MERLTLGGLDVAELLDLIEATAGHPLAADGQALARTSCGETDGNPFFASEIFRGLAETGAIYLVDGRWSRPRSRRLQPAPSVRDVVGLRVAGWAARPNGPVHGRSHRTGVRPGATVRG